MEVDFKYTITIFTLTILLLISGVQYSINSLSILLNYNCRLSVCLSVRPLLGYAHLENKFELS